MIKSANKSHLNEILDIEKIVLNKPWIREQLHNDLVLGANLEHWVNMEDQQVTGYILGFQKKGLRRDYYAKGEHAFLYHLNLVDND